MRPEARYAPSGDLFIAYVVEGNGPIDLVYTPGTFSHCELLWEEPTIARFLRRLTSFSRLILFDRRGLGLSDPGPSLGTMEEQVDDVLAVMDAAGSEQAAIFGSSDGGQLASFFAAAHPERTRALIVYGSAARSVPAPDYPWGVPDELWERVRKHVYDIYLGSGDPEASISTWAPSAAQDKSVQAWWKRFVKARASPHRQMENLDWMRQLDIRHVLDAIQVPTLVIGRSGDPFVPPAQGRDFAEHIGGAKYVELPGGDHSEWFGDSGAIADEIEEFLTGARHAAETDRILATVLFADIVASTEQAASMGDTRWRDVLQRFYDDASEHIDRFRGRQVKTMGDGLLATFDGPARGIRCTQAMIDSARAMGLEIRTGLHTGECEVMGEDVGGIAVHIGARVASIAKPGEILVSSTVKDLVAGSGIEFEDRGSRALKGVPGKWRLFSVQE